MQNNNRRYQKTGKKCTNQGCWTTDGHPSCQFSLVYLCCTLFTSKVRACVHGSFQSFISHGDPYSSTAQSDQLCSSAQPCSLLRSTRRGTGTLLWLFTLPPAGTERLQAVSLQLWKMKKGRDGTGMGCGRGLDKADDTNWPMANTSISLFWNLVNWGL